MRKATVRTALALVLTAAVTAGCGLSSGASLPLDVNPGSIRPVPELNGVELTVGSKDFSENIVLGYIAELALSAAGATVRDLTNIQGSNSARDAMVTGEIDLYWDYTGTGWLNYLAKDTPLPDAQAQFDAVRAEDLKVNGVDWSTMAPLNNTYAFGVNKKVAERLGVRTISDLARLARERPQEATFCLETEFSNRNDGMPGVQQKYGFEVPPANISTLAAGPIYQATADAKTCNFGEVFTTDGRILALELATLEDDRHFFPRYNAALTMRKELADRHPQIAKVLEPVAAKLTSEVMLQLNARVDVKGDDPALVARDWLAKEGFVVIPGAASPGHA